SGENLAVERRGDDFFGTSARNARTFIDPADQDYFIESFTRENVLRSLDEHGAFTITYRLLIDGTSTYVHMKIVRMRMDPAHIIIGVSNVDAQMRQKEELARMQAEHATYARINALSPGFIAIYTVDPDTARYTLYSATTDYSGLGTARAGDDFFATAHRDSAMFVCEEDRELFNTSLTLENVKAEIERGGSAPGGGLFTLQYRMLIHDRPTRVELRAALIDEQDGPQLIIGINNIESRRNLESHRFTPVRRKK
ncbi:MAG: hypothetical protein ACSW8J_07075, partial [bacterium]